jgi:hypothetical protein
MRKSGRGTNLAGLLGLVCALAVGCSQQGARTCVPVELLTAGRFVDVGSPYEANKPVESTVEKEILAQFQQPGERGSPGRQYRILALSGGGAHGAYSVGVLAGWTAAGNRPPFDIVTGISTGGLIATFAFLGSCYDPAIVEMYTSVTSDDIYTRRPRLSLLWSDSAASSSPLKKVIDARMDCAMLQAVARAHAEGRRLYIGTTNLDTKRLVIWDMGAIASSGRPDALELFRKIVLASASVPGFFPPVPIDVEVNGQRYTELHVDGGATTQVFVRASMLSLDRAAVQAGKRPLAGSDVYAIIAGKLYPDPGCSNSRIPGIGVGALQALTGAQTQNDLVRIWTLCMLTGMRFHLTAIPQDYAGAGDSLTFDPAVMRALYEEGYRRVACRCAWRDTPPGMEPAEQEVPRTGTEFLAPVLPSR